MIGRGGRQAALLGISMQQDRGHRDLGAFLQLGVQFRVMRILRGIAPAHPVEMQHHVYEVWVVPRGSRRVELRFLG